MQIRANMMNHVNRIGRAFTLLLFAAVAASCTQPAPPPPTLPLPAEATPTLTALPPSLSIELPTDMPPTIAATPVKINGISPISYEIPPTIQHVTETTAVLFFQLKNPSGGSVLISPVEDAANQQRVPFGLDTRHLITVTDLIPATTYEASVGLGTDETDLQEPTFAGGSWDTIRLTTASDQFPLRVGVIGDSGFGDTSTPALAASMAARDLDFAIHTGDAVYRVYENDSAAEAFAQKWYLPLSSLLHEMPIYPVVGNHDVEPATRNDQGLPFYYEAFPPFDGSDSDSQRRWSSFGRSGVQFIFLDTQAFYGEADNEAQSAWLAERLVDTEYSYSIVVFHIPPFSSDIVHSGDGVPVQRWVSLFEQFNVPLVLSGHAHDYERLEQNGITYIVSGGGSQSLYAQGFRAPQSKIFVSQTHFTLLEIYADHVDITAISKDGDLLDQTTISTP